jgi:hypothetical protein
MDFVQWLTWASKIRKVGVCGGWAEAHDALNMSIPKTVVLSIWEQIGATEGNMPS